MYLTDKKNNTTRERHEHDELEVLLESFSKQVEEIVNEAQNIEVSCCCITTATHDLHTHDHARAMCSPHRKSWNLF
jgi:hypothetical protein